MTEAVSEGEGEARRLSRCLLSHRSPQPSPEEMMAMQEQAMAEHRWHHLPSPEELAMQQMGPDGIASHPTK